MLEADPPARGATVVVALCVLGELLASRLPLPDSVLVGILAGATGMALVISLWAHMGIGREAAFHRWMMLSTLAFSVLMVAVVALEFLARGRAARTGTG